MINDEINRYIHAEIMGGCVNFQGVNASVPCNQCGYEAINHAYRIPDYCSDASPRSLLNEVVAKVVPLSGVDRWGEIAFEVGTQETFGSDRAFADLSDEEWESMYPATAKILARSCVEAHKEAEECNS